MLGNIRKRLRGIASLAGLAVIWVLSSFHAAQAAPFACSGDIYQVQSGQLRIFDPLTSTYMNVGAPNGSYNATGFNTLDNYAYGSQGNNVIRIEDNGAITTLYNVGFSSYAGDVDYNNTLWLRRSASRYDGVNLATGAVTQLNLSGSVVGAADVAFVQRGGVNYLIAVSGTRIGVINLDTGVSQSKNITGLPSSGGFGATWTDSAGRVFTFHNNSGQIFELFNVFGAAPTAQLAAIGQPSGNNDGFSCNTAPFPNLPPLARDDFFTTPVNVPVTGNVLVDNGGGIDEDPELSALTVNTTLISGPSNGAVVIDAAGNFTYTPATYFVGTDTFEYQVTDAAGLTATAVVTITVTGTTGYTTAKTQTGGPSPVTMSGQILSYDIVLNNTGDIPLTGVTVTDTLPDGSTATLPAPVETGATAPGLAAPGQLDVGETWTYSITYTVTQADIDGGATLTNSATTSTAETGTMTQVATAATPVTRTASLTVAKSSSTAALSTPAVAGETISYSFDVTNTGNTTIMGVVPVDSGPSFNGTAGTGSFVGFTPSSATLAPSAMQTFTATYTLSQADIDAAFAASAPATSITNNASVTGMPPSGVPLSPVTASTDTTGLSGTTGITLSKLATTANYASPGDLIDYTLTATNTGSVSLSNVTFSDPLLNPLPCAVVASLAPGASASCVGTYAVTQADIDGGSVINTASVSAADPAGGTSSDTASETVTATQSPGLSVDKSLNAASPLSYSSVGQVLLYDYIVTNSGNTTLTGALSVADNVVNGAGGTVDCSGAPASLAPGATHTCTASYSVTQADIDAGSVTNTAAATIGATTSANDMVTVSANQSPAVTVVKTADTPQPAFSVGNVFTYSYLVTNSGNTTLATPITVSDNVINAAGGTVSCAGEPASLAPGASHTCTASYTITAGDVAIGSVTNTAQATVAGITSAPDSETVPSGASPALTITKTRSGSGVISMVGDTISYDYLVQNSGNADFASDVDVTDDKIGTFRCYDSAGGTNPFLIGQSVTCSASYMVTQADLDAGSVTNLADATAIYAPLGANITVTSPQDSVTVATASSPSMALTKSVAPAALAAAGDTLTYTFAVQNTGNQTISNVTVTDPLISGFACSIASVPVGTTDTSCTGNYVVTQADVDAGAINNTASATATDPSGGALSATGSNTKSTVAPAPALSLVKTALPSPFGAVGSSVTYAMAVSNPGNVTITGLTVTDPLIPSFTCTIATLAPGATDNSCVTAYTVTQADVDTGSITNTASVTGTDPSGGTINTTGGVTTTGPPATPSLDLQKTAVLSGSGTPSVGDTVTFTYVVTNDGNVTISGVSVNEPPGNFSGTGTLPAPTLSSGSTTLAPGATAQFTATYALTQADIDAGGLSNQAQASGTPPGGGTTTDDSDDGDDTDGNATNDPTILALPAVPGILSTKTVTFNDTNGNGYAEVGETLTYTYTVENTGNTTLGSVTITEDLTVFSGTGTVPTPAFQSSSLASPAGTLLPTEIATYAATYALTNADLVAGSVDNQATGSGNPPGGAAITDASDSNTSGGGPDDVTTIGLAIAPAANLIAQKSVSPTTIVRGGTATYTITIENPNASPAIGIDVIDALPANFAFTPGTAMFNGNPVTPTIVGNLVTISGVNVGATEIVTITLDVRVGAGVNGGTHTNQAYATDPATGGVISNVATADLTVPVEAVFDCGDVIGKVFDDRNHDGYQQQGEPGIAAARVATVKGTLITADQYGRFHVPCAALPKDRGSNFILKLDTRSLPTGYRVTTENPRVVRLTPGKLTELNFGATLSRVVRIDLNHMAFVGGSSELSARLKDALPGLVGQLAQAPSVLSLSYQTGTEDPALAQARLDRLARAIDDRWRGHGRYKLVIEKTLLGARP